MLVPSRSIAPEAMRIVLGSKPMIALAVTDLPDPDSPTTQRIWPRASSKEMSSTAWARSMPLGRLTVKPRTESAA